MAGSSGPFNHSKLRRDLQVDKSFELVFDLKNSGCKCLRASQSYDAGLER